MKHFGFVSIFLLICLTRSLCAEDWLDMKIASFKVSGTLMNVVTELHKHVPVRICLEDVQLGGAGNVDNISLDLKDVSLKEVLDRVANAQSDVGWRTTTFLMCPIIHIFRRSSYEDARNPLNVTVSTFALNNDDLWDLPLLVYMNSSDFRNAVNPGGGNLSYAGSKIGGISLGKRIDIRYNVDM